MGKKVKYRSFQVAKGTERGSQGTGEPETGRLLSDPTPSTDALEGVNDNPADPGSPPLPGGQTDLDQAAAEDHALPPKPKSAHAIRRAKRQLKKKRRRHFRRLMSKRCKQRRRQRAQDMAAELSKQSLQNTDKAEATTK
ncbi:hypothetical protein PG991_008073 [Apiospora marii]|uniref:Mitochondrial mRNA-processing protein COX24 C-terminal domain-containing protein n=1 Tax=Apiospora marii TaxID=335849 RepID=A0ABR1RV87_9PEZI